MESCGVGTGCWGRAGRGAGGAVRRPLCARVRCGEASCALAQVYSKGYGLTSGLVGGLGHQHRVLVLRPPVDVVDVVGAVVRVVDPLPAEGQLPLVAVLRPLLLHARQPGVQPVGGAWGGGGGGGGGGGEGIRVEVMREVVSIREMFVPKILRKERNKVRH